MKLLTLSSAKTVKGEPLGYLSGILYLAPHTLGGPDLCAYSTPACRLVCFGGEHASGRMRFYGPTLARLKRTQWFHENRRTFLQALHKDIQALIRKASRESLIPAVRLNGTSDLPFWNVDRTLFDYPQVRFYEYTKRPVRFLGKRPENLDITFSYSGSNETESRNALAAGFRVAAVFRPSVPIGETFLGAPIIDGDASDLRFLDPAACIVGLKAKGHARKHGGEFVVSHAA